LRSSKDLRYADGSTQYELTAGHCFPQGTTHTEMWSLNGPFMSETKSEHAGNWHGRTTWLDGTGTRLSSDGQYHGDVSLIQVTETGHEVGNMIWDGSATTTDRTFVHIREAPAMGNPVCKAGATSGESCLLTINHTNFDFDLGSEGWLRNGDSANAGDSRCSQGGDSGGSVYDWRLFNGNTYAVAVGVISGHKDFVTGGCLQRFTGVEEAVQLWGGDVRTN